MVLWLVVMFVIRSLDRSIDWTTEERLFTSGLRVCDSNAKVCQSMHVVYVQNVPMYVRMYVMCYFLLF